MKKAMSSFDERVAEHWLTMRPTEQRVARFFKEHRKEVLVSSAAALAVKAGTSDATVVRTAKALGYQGLDDLRRSLVSEIDQPSPADRLTRILGRVGGELENALTVTLDIHAQSLEGVRRSVTPELFAQAVTAVINAPRVFVFGIGPSSALAQYLVIQLNRFGIEAASLTNTGLLFADDLHRIRAKDLIIMLAYGRVYVELDALLDQIGHRNAASMLLTDTLADSVGHRVQLLLPVPRGHADMLSMHTGTLGLIEALLVGIAAKVPQKALDSLADLNQMRTRLMDAPMKLGVPGK